MTTSSAIDTTNLLTILGVIAAVWAIISPADRLRFRFCMTWLDWSIGAMVILLAHYLVFAPALQSIGMYYSLGPWRWGLDSSSAVYLLLLAAVLYFFGRARHPVLARNRVAVFRELTESLLLTKRYDELVLLVEPQLPKLIDLSNKPPLLARWVDRLDPPWIDPGALLRREIVPGKSAWRWRWNAALNAVKSASLRRDEASTLANEVLLNLTTSPELTVHLAVSHPHFCLKLLKADAAIRSDFIERYLDALLGAPGSRLYVELKNNQNLNGGHRLYLPENNRLLRFFFSDATTALKNGLDQAIGQAVCRRLDEDKTLVKKLNEPLGSYYEEGRFRCPISSGITLFEIMVHEGIHQGLQDHMWLHYFHHFVEKILTQMSLPSDELEHREWPTPFHFLLYRLVSVATDWVEQCERIVDEDIPRGTRIAEGFDRHFISKEAAKTLGAMLEDLLSSNRLTTSFKIYLLEVVIRRYIKLQRKHKLDDVSSCFIDAVIFGADWPTDMSYRIALQSVFEKIDSSIKHDAAQFETKLLASIAGA